MFSGRLIDVFIYYPVPPDKDFLYNSATDIPEMLMAFINSTQAYQILALLAIDDFDSKRISMAILEEDFDREQDFDQEVENLEEHFYREQLQDKMNSVTNTITELESEGLIRRDDMKGKDKFSLDLEKLVDTWLERMIEKNPKRRHFKEELYFLSELDKNQEDSTVDLDEVEEPSDIELSDEYFLEYLERRKELKGREYISCWWALEETRAGNDEFGIRDFAEDWFIEYMKEEMDSTLGEMFKEFESAMADNFTAEVFYEGGVDLVGNPKPEYIVGKAVALDSMTFGEGENEIALAGTVEDSSLTGLMKTIKTKFQRRFVDWILGRE